jgi:hypothetical protein
MRHAAIVEFDVNERYAACWVESTGVHGWLVGETGVINELRYPAPEHASLRDALRDLVGVGPVDWLLVGGELDLLGRAGMPASEIAATLRCPVMPFECAPFCNGAPPLDDTLKHSPLFAVAFGLALREVMQ